MTALMKHIETYVLGKVPIEGPLTFAPVDIRLMTKEDKGNYATLYRLELKWFAEVGITREEFLYSSLEDGKKRLVETIKQFMYNDILNDIQALRNAINAYDHRKAIAALNRIEKEVLR
ncbi:MAG: hypothetical protein M0R68_15040 [Bacteroidetes bacterium]|nr:hypothetical protein [Bacteroidota bacterium]